MQNAVPSPSLSILCTGTRSFNFGNWVSLDAQYTRLLGSQTLSLHGIGGTYGERAERDLWQSGVSMFQDSDAPF